jgi:hypothetical protein
MATSTSLSAFEGKLFEDQALFRSTIGGASSIYISWLDIAFAENKLSQFMHEPTLLH